MSLRWYTTVIDAHDAVALGEWWRETLGWQTVHDTEDEYVIVPSWVTPELVESTPWDQIGPGLVFLRVAGAKGGKNRLHLDLAPESSDDRDAEIARLVERGASLADIGQGDDVSWTVLRDPEGNEFCVLSRRDS